MGRSDPEGLLRWYIRNEFANRKEECDMLLLAYDMRALVVEAKAEAIAALDRQERGDVEDLAAFQPLVGLDRRAVVVVDQIAMALAERVVDLAEDGPEGSAAVASEPEAHRIEYVAQHARHGHQHDLAVADIGHSLLPQDVLQPDLEIGAVARAMVGTPEADGAAAVDLQPSAGGAFQLGDAFGGVHFGHRLLGAQYRVAQRSLP